MWYMSTRQKHLILEVISDVRLHLLYSKKFKLADAAKMQTELSTKQQV